MQIILFATEGGCAPPPPPTKAVRIILFATGGGCTPPTPLLLRPPPTPPLFKGHRGCKKRTSVRIYACAKERLCGSFCLQLGRLRPPQPPRFLKDHRWLQRKRTSVSIYSCAKGRLCGSFCLQMGGAAPPSTPPLFKGHRWLHKKNKRQDLCLRSRKFKGHRWLQRKRTSVRIYVGAKGRLSFCLHLWGAAPPPTPPLFKDRKA